MLSLNDLKHTLRTLAGKPGFTAAAALVLALGIGANTAMFTIIDATLIRPLPYPDPDRLVRLYESNLRNTDPYNIVSTPNFRDWQRTATSFTQMAASRGRSRNLSSADGGLPERIDVAECTYNLISTLGVQPEIGRNFQADDDRPGADAVVIITHGLWQRRFGGQSDVLGKALRLNGASYTIVGVMPSWFRYPSAKSQLWVPLFHEANPREMESRGNHNLSVILGRLKPGVAVEQARTEMDGIAKRIWQQYPEALTGKGATTVLLKDRTVAGVKTLLLVLLGAVGMVLLIACVNVTNLFLARAVGRRRESAIRLALGATRKRLLQQFLLESIVISVLGGAAGLVIASFGTSLLVKLATDLPRPDSIQMNPLVLLFTAGVALIAGVLSGLAPAFSSSDINLASAIHQGGRSSTGSRKTNRLRQLLVAAEVGISMVLLAGAGLLIKSFAEMRSVDPGFSAPRTMTMSFSLPDAQYRTEQQVTSFFTNLVERVKSLPGVESAGIVNRLPLEGVYDNDPIEVAGRPPLPPGHFNMTIFRAADPGYFQAMGIPIKRGSVFTTAERGDRAGKMLISESTARTYFPGEDPIGKRIRVAHGGTYEVAGITGDVLKDLTSAPEPTIYAPLLSGRWSYGTIVVRVAVDPNTIALPVQKEIGRLDPDLPVFDVITADELLSQATASRRFGLTLLILFASLAALLAGVGLYGVLSYTMGERASELGIRMALGATRMDLSKLAFVQGMRPALLGLAAGLLVAVWSTQAMQTLLFHVQAGDPQVLSAAAFVLAAVAVLASLGPVLRAARTDPVTALRSE